MFQSAHRMRHWNSSHSYSQRPFTRNRWQQLRHTRTTGSFLCFRHGRLTSYLTDHTQFVRRPNEHSTSRKLLCSVPQDSVLSPFLYSMYTAPLVDIIIQHGLNFHFYADYTQIHLSFNPKATAGEPRHSLSRVQLRISDITNWMTSNKLMLNSCKTQLFLLNACHRPRPLLKSFPAGRDLIQASHAAKNIGV